MQPSLSGSVELCGVRPRQGKNVENEGEEQEVEVVEEVDASQGKRRRGGGRARRMCKKNV